MPIFAATGGTEESCQACLGRNNYRVNKNIVTCEAAVMVFYLAKAYRFRRQKRCSRINRLRFNQEGDEDVRPTTCKET
jgi:hypothetical protein